MDGFDSQKYVKHMNIYNLHKSDIGGERAAQQEFPFPIRCVPGMDK
jgi:hypothetical protein